MLFYLSAAKAQAWRETFPVKQHRRASSNAGRHLEACPAATLGFTGHLIHCSHQDYQGIHPVLKRKNSVKSWTGHRT